MGEFLEFLIRHWALTSAFLVVLFLLVIVELKRKTLGYKDVGSNEAIRLINQQNAVVLDVREDGEFKSGHIINAVHIPLGVLESRTSELGEDRARPVVVICKSGQRSAQASVALVKQGFSNVYKLSGGMMAWQSANMPVVK